jgi:hypothetical protein
MKPKHATHATHYTTAMVPRRADVLAVPCLVPASNSNTKFLQTGNRPSSAFNNSNDSSNCMGCSDAKDAT